jgi:hypothetical protein
MSARAGEAGSDGAAEAHDWAADEARELRRENARLRGVMQSILDDADERYYTLHNDEWFLIRLRRALDA